MADDQYSRNDRQPQGIMKDKISTVCETIQNMEMRVEDLESKSENFKLEADQRLNDIKAEKIQQSQLTVKLNSLKGIVEGLKCLQQNVNDDSEILRDNSELLRKQILEQQNEQTYDMNCFEENMFHLAESYEEAPQLYNTAGLMDVLLALKQEMQNQDNEMIQFRKELEAFDLRYCNYGSCNNDLKTALNVFETSYGDVSSETKKLSTDLDKLNASLQNLRQELVMLKSRHA